MDNLCFKLVSTKCYRKFSGKPRAKVVFLPYYPL